MPRRPMARTDGVITERIDDELVVYDQMNQMAHCLSPDATRVWERCDGRRSEAEIARALDLAPSAVQQALDELSGCGLLDHPPVPVGGYSRRQALGRIATVGGASFTAPLIYSVVVGSPAAAASTCVPTGTVEPTCTATVSGTKATDAKCCAGQCYNHAGTKTCVTAACAASGTFCLSATTCCSGSCVALACAA